MKNPPVAEFRAFLESGYYQGIEDLFRLIRIPEISPYLHQTNVDDVRAIMRTSATILAFLNPEELREIRIIAALAECCEVSRNYDRLAKPGFKWPHEMPINAAVHNLGMAWMIQYNVAGWRKSGVVDRVIITNSGDGGCPHCQSLVREYSLQDMPELPAPGCTNVEIGCRCGVRVTWIDGKPI